MSGTGPLYLYAQDLRPSGAVRNALTYARLLSAHRPTTLLVGYGSGLLRSELEGLGATPVVLGERPGRLGQLRAAWRLRRFLRRAAPGTLLSVGNYGHVSTWLATRGLSRHRLVFRISNEFALGAGWRDRLRDAWMRRLVRDADALAIVGSRIARHPVFADALRSGRAAAIPNGIDLADARRRAAAPVPHCWLAEAVPVAITAGRLRHQKNQELLIRAAGIARATRRLRLVILGGGPDETVERLRRAGHEAGLGEDLLIGGEVPDVPAWVARAGVFALPSRYEGSSMALLEAMAVGTPVVATRSAGDAATVLDEGRFGLLVDPDDADGLAAALLRQLSADAVRPGERVRDYALDATVARYLALIDRAEQG